MTQWAFEVPIKHLEDFHKEQDYIFALQHLCLKYPEYLHYLQDQKDYKVILDNSSNELGCPCSNSDLLDTALAVNATSIIAPDQDDWDETYTYEVYKELKREAQGALLNIIYVVRNLKELDLALAEGLSITIPYEFRFDAPLILLKQCNHFLGLNNPLEVRVFHPDSIDTGMPIKLALQGVDIKMWMNKGCPHIHSTPDVGSEDFFNTTLTSMQLKLAKENIKRLKEVCSYE